MKPRSSEAARLEADYLARVRSVLALRDPSEVEEVIESLREHIEEEFLVLADDEISLVQMANVLERLGPPEVYVSDESDVSEKGPSVSEEDSAGGKMPTLVPFGKIDIGSYLNEAIQFYRQNFFMFLLITVVVFVLHICSLFLLAGPLMGGFLYMVLCALRREGQKLELGDMTDAFCRKFFPLLGMFFLTLVPVLLGYSLFIIPGLLLTTIWLFSDLLMVDKDLGILDSLGKSFAIVNRRGFIENFAIAFLVISMNCGPSLVMSDHIGLIISLLLSPLGISLMAIAYERQVGQDTGELADLFEGEEPVIAATTVSS